MEGKKARKEKKPKKMTVEIAPAVALLLKDEKRRRNEGIPKGDFRTAYGDLVNEALDRFLPPASPS